MRVQFQQQMYHQQKEFQEMMFVMKKLQEENLHLRMQLMEEKETKYSMPPEHGLKEMGKTMGRGPQKKPVKKIKNREEDGPAGQQSKETSACVHKKDGPGGRQEGPAEGKRKEAGPIGQEERLMGSAFKEENWHHGHH